MSTFYIKNNQINDDKIEIIGDDYNHIKNVLRCKISENIDICDETATRYKTKIVEFTDKTVICEIKSIEENSTEPNINVTLYQGLPKADKLELIIQKTTEIGVNHIYPVQMARSIAKLDEKNTERKQERWNKICIEASKQCGRQMVPNVYKAINFKNIIENISKYDIVLLPYENEKSVTLKKAITEIRANNINVNNIAIIIGPEGGFSEEEVNTLSEYKNVYTITLGPRILRTETAGLVTLAMLMYEFEL